MRDRNVLAPYRKLYAFLLHLYPMPYRTRYGKGMEQTFTDLLRETAEREGGLLGHALWMYGETFTEIVKLNLKNTIMHNKRIVRLMLVVVSILLIPFIAMQFSDEVVWSVGDFVVAGILLLGTGLVYEVSTRVARNGVTRAAFGVAIFTGLLLTWVNLAVGVIGSEDTPVNILFIGVYIVGVVGALIARFEASGMARAMIATAIAQILVPLVAMIIWRPEVQNGHEMGVVGVFGVCAFFATLWLISAGLFRNAAGRAGKGGNGPLAVAGPKA